MKIGKLLAATFAFIATGLACQADMLVRTNITRSIPAEIAFCARVELHTMRKVEQAANLIDAVQQQFGKQIEAIDEFSSLGLRDIECIWVNVAEKDKTLIVLEGPFQTEAILNSPVVTGSRRLVRPGTIIAIEIDDEKTGEPNLAVVINANVIALGPPYLVDAFVLNYVDGHSVRGANGQAVMKRLATSEAMILGALLQLPEEEIKQKPFLATLDHVLAEINIQSNVNITVSVAMQDDAKATALKDLISGFLGLGLASEIKLDYPEMKAAILDELQLSTDGKTVTLSSRIDLDLLRKLLRTRGLQLN